MSFEGGEGAVLVIIGSDGAVWRGFDGMKGSTKREGWCYDVGVKEGIGGWSGWCHKFKRK